MLSSFLYQLLWVFLVSSPEKTPTTEYESLSAVGKMDCPKGEHYDQCTFFCQRNCTNWDKPVILCPAVCYPACICDEGTVRGDEGQCINTDLCPKEEDTSRESTDSTSDSDIHQIFWSCEVGQIRGPDGRCKLPESETHLIEGGLRCPANEHYSRCDGYCQKDCKNYDQEVIRCTKACVWGCICDEGMVRGPGGKCIKTEECPERKKHTTPAYGDADARDNHGCPAQSKCDKYCKATYHKGYGVCFGRRHLYCECRT